jgi:hypothetical protein
MAKSLKRPSETSKGYIDEGCLGSNIILGMVKPTQRPVGMIYGLLGMSPPRESKSRTQRAAHIRRSLNTHSKPS